jgi:hypothetical protein
MGVLKERHENTSSGPPRSERDQLFMHKSTASEGSKGWICCKGAKTNKHSNSSVHVRRETCV